VGVSHNGCYGDDASVIPGHRGEEGAPLALVADTCEPDSQCTAPRILSSFWLAAAPHERLRQMSLTGLLTFHRIEDYAPCRRRQFAAVRRGIWRADAANG